MSKYIPGDHKHLTAVDRLYIERQLNAGSSFKDIVRFLCKAPTTIFKEVRSHRLSDFYPGRGLFLNAKNFCIHRFHCQKKNVCGKLILCDIKCTSCPSCNQNCKDFVKKRCNRLGRAPYVCNGCDKGHARCTIPHKYYYDALFADRRYRETLRDSRSGINLSKRELLRIDSVVTPLIRQGHSPYQIVVEHPELGLSVRSIYQYIAQALETSMDDYRCTSIYYCDPMRSGQKGGIENVHTKLREILPKGTSFEHLTQWDLNLIVNKAAFIRLEVASIRGVLTWPEVQYEELPAAVQLITLRFYPSAP